ncbi:MAG: RagB/SusD family nutrient uptake outer membrane protein [Tannerella sp.]|jgi:hypothetical protein|nr:RagB/SusD family nutrient uptake outer membrane protein [Tannerella sp.]
MKNIFLTIITGIFVMSCSDYLDVVPDNVPVIEHAFLDRTGTERYLATCYTYLPYFSNPNGDAAILGSDEFYCVEDPYYNGIAGNYYGLKVRRGEQNTNSPLFNVWDGLNNGRAMFRALRDCNLFLENIYNVGADLSEAETRQWAAEVKYLKAFYHYYLLINYGPIPLQKVSLPISANSEEVRVYRDPFDECVDYIATLLDEAIPDLPSAIQIRSTDMGHITRPIAAALKAKLLVFAASPLFNGNPDFAGLKDNRQTALFTATEDKSKWTRAVEACKQAIDEAALGGHDFYEFTKYPNISDSTKRLMSLRSVVTDRWNKEIIWSADRYTMYDYQRASTPFFFGSQSTWMPTDPWLCATLATVEMFYSNHGVPIDEDIEFADRNRWYNPTPAPADHKFFIKPGYETALINIDRETRFYANLAFDGCVWFGNGRYKDPGQGAESEQSWVLKTKAGEENGKRSSMRYAMTGYYIRKSSHYESASPSQSSNVIIPSTFPLIRLADIYLLYAEALNESKSAPDAEVYEYIDKVRERAGLPGVVESWREWSKYPSKPTTQEGMREIIQRERMIELAFEGVRYWDIRRWKTAYDLLNKPIQGLNPNGATTQDYNNVVTYEIPNFTTKEYLSPIRQYNIRVNANLVQNPYWE